MPNSNDDANNNAVSCGAAAAAQGALANQGATTAGPAALKEDWKKASDHFKHLAGQAAAGMERDAIAEAIGAAVPAQAAAPKKSKSLRAR